MIAPLRVLFVEDSADDALLVERELWRAGFTLESQRVETEMALRAALDTRTWDLVLSDFSMPLFDGLSAHAIVQQMSPDIPFIFVSGRIGEERAADAMRRGVKDYILKDNLTRLVPAIRRELEQAEQRRGRQAADRALKESEEKYRQLVEVSIQGILIVQKGLIMYCNHATARMFGFEDPAALTGMPGLQLVHPEDHHQVLRTGSLEMLESKGKLYPYYRGIKKDGSTIWYEAHAATTTWQGRSAVQWVLLDITERKRAEEALHTNQRLLLTVFETIPHALFVKDLDGRYIIVNRAWCERYHCSPDEAIGAMTVDIPGRPEADKRRAAEEDHRVMHVELRPVSFQGVDTTGDGKALYFQSFKAPLHDDAGRVTGLVGVVVDTTDIKRAEAELGASQNLLQTVFDTIPHMVLVKDVHSRVVMVNRTYLETYGVAAEQVLGRETLDLPYLSPVERQGHLNEDRLVFESSKAIAIGERHFTVKGGRKVPVHSIKAPLRNDRGEVIGLVGAFVDLSDLKEAQRKADIAHARLSDAIESLPAAFFLYDAEERLVLWNSRVEDFFPDLYTKLRPGMFFEEVVRVTLPTIVLQDSELESFLPRRVHQFRHNPGLFEQQYKSGRWLQGIDRRTSDGGTVSLRFDVTDLKNREAELRQAQKMEVVGQLTGGVAHDLNNLLQVISGSVMLARLGMDTALPVYEHLSTAIDGCMRAAGLTQQLLAFSRKQVLRLEPLDVNQVLQTFKPMLSRVLPGDIVIRLNPAPDLKNVPADRGLFEQVVMNLAVNARDAMPGGGGLRFETGMRVVDAAMVREQTWAKPGEYAVLHVADSGCGMTPEVLEHIFEPFFTTKDPGKGTGLGLSTVYGIVRQHHGFIEVQSTPNGGTTFSTYWPVGSIAERKVTESGRPLETTGSESILLVDDNSDVLRVLSEVLRQAGYRVIPLERGAEAAELLSADPSVVDAAVLDLMMPEMSGIECYRQLMAIRADLPVLFCSGWASAENEEFLTAHRLPTLPKPVTPEDLTRAVRKLLDSRTKR